MWFTEENTKGYSGVELARLNKELMDRLAVASPDDFEAHQEIFKVLADEVKRR